MSKDDYFVLVYRLLDYLYTCLKTGAPVDHSLLTHTAFGIPQSYLEYLFKRVYEQGFVDGVNVVNRLGSGSTLDISDIEITPKGIEYLLENNMMSKVKKTIQTLGDIKNLIL